MNSNKRRIPPWNIDRRPPGKLSHTVWFMTDKNTKLRNYITEEVIPLKGDTDEEIARYFYDICRSNRFYIICENLFNVTWLHELKVCKGITLSGSSQSFFVTIRRGNNWSFIIPPQMLGVVSNKPVESSEDIYALFDMFQYEGVSLGSVIEKWAKFAISSYLYRPDHYTRMFLEQMNYGGCEWGVNYGRFDRLHEYDGTAWYPHHLRYTIDPHVWPRLINPPATLDKLQLKSNETAAIEYTAICIKEPRIPVLLIKDSEGNNVQPVQGEKFTSRDWYEVLQFAVQREYFVITDISEVIIFTLCNTFNDIVDELMVRREEAKKQGIHFESLVKRGSNSFIGRQQTTTRVDIKTEEELSALPDEIACSGYRQYQPDTYDNGHQTPYYYKEEVDYKARGLIQVGVYTVSMARLHMLDIAESETDAGNIVVRIYIDSITLVHPLQQTELLGSSSGQFKYTLHTDCAISNNQFVSDQKVALPGISGREARNQKAKELLENVKTTHTPTVEPVEYRRQTTVEQLE